MNNVTAGHKCNNTVLAIESTDTERLINVSTTQPCQLCIDYSKMEDIFEPRPSTSSEDIQLNAESTYKQTGVLGSKEAADRGNWVKKSDAGPRKLPILPRISQYERHPLLQERSPSGLSQLEELTNMLQRQKSFDIVEDIEECDLDKIISGIPDSPVKATPVASDLVGDKAASNVTQVSTTDVSPHVHTNIIENNANSVSKNLEHTITAVANSPLKDESTPNYNSYPAVKRLEPRGAFYERHPLLEKSESGLSELEIYLHEKEQELLMNSPIKDDSVKNNFRTINDHEFVDQTSHKKLLPRVNQYEKHALLESRDEQGLSPIDHFLSEKEQLIIERNCQREIIDQEEDSTGSKGKCSEKCVCKNATCTICKPNHSGQNMTNNQPEGTLPKSEEYSNSIPGQELTDHSSEADVKSPLIKQENVQDELIDLRDPAYILDEEEEDNSDIIRSHPPLIKKESSRETVIEPKESNKRVHFERTLSDKEREMRALCAAGGNSNTIQGKLTLTHKNDTTLAENGKHNKKKFWSLWGKNNKQKKICHNVNKPCKNSSKGNQQQPATQPTLQGEVIKGEETQQLVTGECQSGKDQNENNKKAKKKACIIL